MRKSHIFQIENYTFKCRPHRAIASTAITGRMIKKATSIKGFEMPSLADLKSWATGKPSISSDLIANIIHLIGCILEDEALIAQLFRYTAAGKVEATTDLLELSELDAIDEVFSALPPMSMSRAIAEIIACNGFFPESVTSLIRAMLAAPHETQESA